ncbi:MAG: 2-amino-3,7-dideoxy-D-threo-hept-6-ulosonate synthase [bacterium]
MIGKQIRMERIINRETHRTVIIPMDHGVTLGPIAGLKDMKTAVGMIAEGGADAVILHKGMVPAGYREGNGKAVGLIIHLSGSTVLSPDSNAKVCICTVEEAIKLGADGVSIHVNLGADTESSMIKDLGETSRVCQEWGMPLIAMMYVRGEKIKNQFDVKYIKHAARVGAELGVDMVKINYTGSTESFREVVEGCPVPVVIAGGEKVETDKELLEMIFCALAGGAAGVSIGRNVFQHDRPDLIVGAISRMVHHNYSVEKAMQVLEKSMVS